MANQTSAVLTSSRTVKLESATALDEHALWQMEISKTGGYIGIGIAGPSTPNQSSLCILAFDSLKLMLFVGNLGDSLGALFHWSSNHSLIAYRELGMPGHWQYEFLTYDGPPWKPHGTTVKMDAAKYEAMDSRDKERGHLTKVIQVLESSRLEPAVLARESSGIENNWSRIARGGLLGITADGRQFATFAKLNQVPHLIIFTRADDMWTHRAIKSTGHPLAVSCWRNYVAVTTKRDKDSITAVELYEPSSGKLIGSFAGSCFVGR